MEAFTFHSLSDKYYYVDCCRLHESLEDLKEAKDNMERYYENEIKDFKVCMNFFIPF